MCGKAPAIALPHLFVLPMMPNRNLTILPAISNGHHSDAQRQNLRISRLTGV
jgi:hypothetical protein